MTRVAILISGGGSNMVSLVQDMNGDHPARPVLVMSNRPDAGGLAKAKALGVETTVVDHKTFDDRAAFDGPYPTDWQNPLLIFCVSQASCAF